MDQLFEKFGLHVNLLIAQMVNFGILLLVLYKFVYQPVLKILDQRREKIEKSLQQAKEIEIRTQQLQEDINQQMAAAKKQSDALIMEAREIGERARNEILIRTNQEVSMMLEKAKADIQAEKEHMMTDIQDYIVKTSIIIVEKILRNKLDEKTKEQLVLDSMKELPNEKMTV
jgi:F-type H+-transporting ATPase subunit b